MNASDDDLRYDQAESYVMRVRIDAATALHHPQSICQVHHIAISPTHTCAGPVFYRCPTCAQTRATPCRTWRTLTGQETP